MTPYDEWRARISRRSTDAIALGWLPELKEEVHGRQIVVAVEYEDVHHRKWASYLYLEKMDDTGYVRDGQLNIVELKNYD